MEDLKDVNLNVSEILDDMFHFSETIEASDGKVILKLDSDEYERLLKGSQTIPEYVDMDKINSALDAMQENVCVSNDGSVVNKK